MHRMRRENQNETKTAKIRSTSRVYAGDTVPVCCHKGKKFNNTGPPLPTHFSVLHTHLRKKIKLSLFTK